MIKNLCFFMNKEINIPNALTVLRLLSAPVVLYFIFADRPYTALIIFLAAMATDIFDGAIARKYNMSTKLGKIMDPVSDKIIYAFLLFGILIKNKLVGWIWFFIITVIFFIVAYIFMNKYKVKYPTKLGRTCAFLQIVPLLAMVAGNTSNLILTLFAVFLVLPPLHYSIEIVKAMKK